MDESTCSHHIVGECVNLQFHNSNCSYSLSVVNFYGKELQTFAFARVTFGTTTFSKELLFQSTYNLKFLVWNCIFLEQLLLRGFPASNFCNFLFDNEHFPRPWPSKIHINSGSEKIASPLFQAVSFVYK